MLRVDRSVTPTMAKTPTLARWELDLLRTLGDVVRLGHVRSVSPGRLELEDGSVEIAPDALVVNCAADGLKHPPLVPIWQPSEITLQPVRAGFPCFGAAIAGYVEATRGSDEEKNAVCAPSPYPDSMVQWAQMNIFGMQNAATFGAEADIREWAHAVALNPARIPPGHVHTPGLDDALARLQTYAGPGVASLVRLAGSTR
jgi:hypothetical protein